MRDLKLYRRKRDPQSTPEPFGGDAVPPSLPPDAARAFVVQQHAARSMHWDLRLEIDGVLASWAIPRGPSLDPADRRLAVRTEDHPLEYADFEGVIPSGNYGAGAMIVWDRGSYRIVDGRSPDQGLEAGKLDLALGGHKLRGRFALVRTRGAEGRDWLLLYKGERSGEDGDVVETQPHSVLSGLSVVELAAGVDRSDEVVEAARAAGALDARPDARELRPMLAATGEGPFTRDGWIFELKYDGVRILAERSPEHGVRLFARSGGERTGIYPEVARAVGRLPVREFVLDGETVALDETGRSSFERIQRRFTQSDPEVIERACVETPVVFYAFDLLQAGGLDLRGCALRERKRILSLFAPRSGDVRFVDHLERDGEALFHGAQQHALEGVVAKRADSSYESGRRARSWLKLKVPRRAVLAIVGWLHGRGSRRALGSLMLAWRRGERLVYAGNAGSGLGEDRVEELLESLGPARIDAPAVEDAPPLPERGGAWVRPERVCEVSFTEVTRAGLLRHPVFERLLDGDLSLVSEAPASREPAPEPAVPATRPSAQLRLTRLDKVFWPLEGHTKGDLLGYYEAVWPWIGPYLRDRPVVLTRYPDGIEGKSFYQKNAPEATPDWVERESIDGTDYFVCNDLRTLLYVVNSGAIPLHVWSARRGQLERPDWLILDLDPKQAPFARVVQIARHLHRLLDGFGAAHYAKTSGQDGLHVMLPLGGRLAHADATRLAEVLARVVCAELPDVATVARPLAARGDKVYLDYLQNGRGKLIAAPLSVRPRPGAPVSMPLRWSQVTGRLDPGRWTLKTAPARLRRSGDPFLGALGEPIDVEGLLAALVERLADAS